MQIYFARRFTQGAAKGKQSSGVLSCLYSEIEYPIYTETVNYNFILSKLFCISWKYKLLNMWPVILHFSSNEILRKWCNVVLTLFIASSYLCFLLTIVLPRYQYLPQYQLLMTSQPTIN